MEQCENDCLIRLEGEGGIGVVEELKNLLLTGLASGKDLLLDLESLEEIDISIMQLLWAAEREANRTGKKIVIRLSEADYGAANDAGFGRFHGEPIRE